MKPLVSVLTPTIIGREPLLAECEAAVAAQTFQNHEHLILLDDEYAGCSATVNQLAAVARGDWLFIVADDDILLPRCLELHVAAADAASVVYAPPLVWGEDAAQFRAAPPNIPAVALISRRLWDKLGGYNTNLANTEDRDLWVRAEAKGARFVRADSEPTWVYRFHDNAVKNKSRW